MRIGLVMPVVLVQQALLDTTREAVDHLKTRHDATLYVICNRLHICLPEELRADLERRFGGAVHVLNEPGVVRSVAESWNKGCEMALADGAEYIAMVANDTRLLHDCLDALVDYGDRGEADLWSGISYNTRPEIDPALVSDGADFTCFMIRPDTIRRHGWFDPNFKPAYFEDNDYYGRVVLGGGRCRVVHRAQFFHHGSLTIRGDAEAAHHVSYWFGANRAYFARKWGVQHPAGSSTEVLARYYRHPFNNAARPLTWFPEDGNP